MSGSAHDDSADVDRLAGEPAGARRVHHDLSLHHGPRRDATSVTPAKKPAGSDRSRPLPGRDIPMRMVGERHAGRGRGQAIRIGNEYRPFRQLLDGPAEHHTDQMPSTV